jgi:hypothetical protein
MALTEQVFGIDHLTAGEIPTPGDCYFDSKILETVIQEIIAKETGDPNAKLADTVCTERTPCLTFVIATSAIHAEGPAVVFRSYNCKGANANKCAIWQAARCTTAAPNFFEPMYIEVPVPGGIYLDGGRLYNNPSELAIEEANRIWPTIKHLYLISIGTGRQRGVDFIDIKDIESRKRKRSFTSAFSFAAGLETSEMASNLITLNRIQEACIALSESVEPIHQRVLGLACSSDPTKRFQYYRFSVQRGMDTIQFQEWKANLRIAQVTCNYMHEKEQQVQLNSCVQDLLKPSTIGRETMESEIDLPSVEAAAFDSHRDELDARCHPGTREDLLREIREWAKDPQGKCMFWLNGMAGTGKSTISRTVAQSFAEDGQLGASFFFKRGEGERGNASKFFTTIIRHLVRRVPTLVPYVKSAINAEPGISEKSLKEQFEKLIFQPLSQAKQTSMQISTLVIVVDALDECEREGDIRTILHLLLRTQHLQSVRLRIFLTSRPELPIRLEFKRISAAAHQDVVLQDIPQLTIEHDISIYLMDELAKIKTEYNEIHSADSWLPPNWPGDDNIKALAAMAIPLFIFAATVCRFVGDRRWNPRRRLATVLEYQTASQASNLDRTYLPILQQLVDGCTCQEKESLACEFREIIGSIVILTDPLPISSLARLLGISKEDVDSRLDDLHSVLSIPSDQGSPVRLLHLSFRDFLLDREKKGKWFWVDEMETHGMIATRCIELMSNCLRENMCGLEYPGKLRNEIDGKTLHDCLPPDVRYACQYWIHHLKERGDRIRDEDEVHLFLKKHFLHWLEALSLMGNISQSIVLIDTLQSLVPVSSFWLQCTLLISFIRLMKAPKHLVFFMTQGALSCNADGLLILHLFNYILLQLFLLPKRLLLEIYLRTRYLDGYVGYQKYHQLGVLRYRRSRATAARSPPSHSLVTASC